MAAPNVGKIIDKFLWVWSHSWYPVTFLQLSWLETVYFNYLGTWKTCRLLLHLLWKRKFLFESKIFPWKSSHRLLYTFLIILCSRNDEYDEAVGSLMTLGGSALRFGANWMIDYFSTSSNDNTFSTVNKLGVAANQEDFSSSSNSISTTTLSPEQLLEKQKVGQLLNIKKGYSIYW